MKYLSRPLDDATLTRAGQVVGLGRRCAALDQVGGGDAVAVGLDRQARLLAVGDAGQQLGPRFHEIKDKLATPACEFGVIAGGKGDGRGWHDGIPGDDDGTVGGIGRGMGGEQQGDGLRVSSFRRPPELADDQTTTVPVIAHAIRACAELGWATERVCCLYPGVPLLRPESLVQALALLDALEPPRWWRRPALGGGLVGLAFTVALAAAGGEKMDPSAHATSLWDVAHRDRDGNVVTGDAILEDTHDSFVHSGKALVATVGVKDLVIVVLDRPRHKKLIEEIRAAGARIRLISDGDLSAGIAVAVRGAGVHAVMGTGGAPEGVEPAAVRRWPQHVGQEPVGEAAGELEESLLDGVLTAKEAQRVRRELRDEIGRAHV